MDDDIDIYEDLPSFEAKESEKYKEEIKELSQKCNNFQQENTELQLKVAELSESNKSLSVNLSSLLKTAKAEIGRKDRMITELRQKIDNMAFRRSGYAKSKAQRFPNKPANDNTYTPFIRQEPLYVGPTQPVSSPNQPDPHEEFEEEIDDTEQKYEPEKIASTVFGERLRKKILLEQEVERIQKEEEKRVMSENEANSVKTEVEAIKENAIANNLVKNETQEVPNNFVEETALSIKSAPLSNGSSFNSYEEDDRNLSERPELSNNLLGKRFNKDILFSEHKRRRIEDERYHSDDTRHYNFNVHHDGRFNQENNDNYRNPRNTANRISRRRGSDNREDFEGARRAPGQRSKPNYRSRSRSPDRRYVEKRADRHRTDKYRAYKETCENRRHNGLNRNKDYCNKFSKDAHDLRAKINHRFETKIGGRSEYNNYKNSKLDEECKRGRHASPPSAKSRSRSNGRIRDKPDDKMREGRSKSSNRLANIWEEANESDNAKIRLKETKSSVDDRRKVVDDFKLEKSPRTSCEKETTNKQFGSSALLPDVSEKKESDKQQISTTLLTDISEKRGTDKQHSSTIRLPDALASISKSNEVPEDIRKLRKSVKTRAKDRAVIETKNRDSELKLQKSPKTTSEEEMMNKQIASSEILPGVSEKEVTNQTIAPTAEVPNVLSSAPKSSEVPEELQKQLKGRTRSKDLEPMIPEQKDRDSVPKSQISLRKSSEKEVTKKLLVSLELLPDASTSTSETYEAPERIKKQRKEARGKSKDSESTILEEKNPDSEPKFQIKLRKSSEKEVTNTQLHSLDLSSEFSKKDVESQQLASTEQLPIASAPESCELTEEIKMERKDARRKSKDPEPSIAEEKNRDSKAKSEPPSHKSSEKEVTNKQLASSALLPSVSEKEVTNQTFASTEEVPNVLSSSPKSCEVPEELKKQLKGTRRRSKDLEPIIPEQKDRDSVPKSQISLRKSSEKEVTKKLLVSLELLPDASTSTSETYEAPERIKKQRKDPRGKSKDSESMILEEKNPDFEAKFQIKLRKSSEKEGTNTQLHSLDLSSEFSKKDVKSQQLASTEQLPIASAPESCELTEEIKLEHKGARRKSKDPEPSIAEEKNRDSKAKSQPPSHKSSEKEGTNKELASSALLVGVSEKDMTNQTFASTEEVPNVLSSSPKSCEVPEELKKQLKGTRRRSKDLEPMIPEQKDRDSVAKSQISLRKSSEKEVTKKLLVSLELLPDASTSTSETYEAPERLKKQRKDTRRISKDSESMILEEKNPDFEAKFQIKSRKSSEKEVSNTQLHSPDLLSEVSGKDVKNQQLASTEQSPTASAPESCELTEEIKMERKGARRKSKDPEPSIAEEKNRDSKAKSQSPSLKSSEKEVTNKQLASSALLTEASKKEVTNQQLISSTKLPDDLTSAPKSSEVPEEIKKQRKSSRVKSKNPVVSEHKDRNSKSKSPPTRKSSEKEATNKKLVTTTELPDVSNLASGSRDAPEEIKTQQKSGKRKLKDLKSTVTEEKDRDSEPKSKSPTRTNSEKDETNEQLASCVEDLISKLEYDEISDKQKSLNDESAKPVASLQIIRNEVDNQGKFISSILEKDAEIPSVTSETLTPSDVGSRSFREEKIENIEKFIQNYQDDDDICCPIPKRGTGDLDYANKSCDSTSSILDTLSMDIDVIANCNPENALLDNSFISEQLLLESLSTPVKKINPPLPPDIIQPPLVPPSCPEEIKHPPLPPNSPPEETKQPPLPPNSPPEETKQPPLPPNSPLEETKQPPLSPNYPPEEMEIQSSPSLSSSDNKQQNPSPDETKQILQPLPSPDETKKNLPPLPSPDEKKNLPPLASPDETKQNLPPLPTPDEAKLNLPPLPTPDEAKLNLPPLPSPDEKKQNLPPLPSPEEKKQNLPPLPSPEEKKQNLPPLPSPDDKKQILSTLTSPDDKKQVLSTLTSPDKSKQVLPPLSSPDKNQESPLLSHETKNQALPTLPSSEKEIEPIQPLTCSGDKKQRLSSPHPSPDRKKRRLLSSFTSSDDKNQPPSPPLPTQPEEKSTPALKEDTKPVLLLVSTPEKEKAGPLSLAPVDESKPILLAQPAPSEKDDLRPLLPPAQSEKGDSQLSVLSAQSEKDDLLLSTPEDGHEKEGPQLLALPAPSCKDNLPLSLSPNISEKQNLEMCVLSSPNKMEDIPLSLSATSSEQKDTTASQPSVPAKRKSHPPAPVNKESQAPASPNTKSHPPAPVNKESQPPTPVNTKSQSTGAVDKKSQPTVAVDKKSQISDAVDKKSQPPAPANKKSQPTLEIDKKSESPAPTDKKSQPAAPADKKSQFLVPVDKKSQPSVAVGKKSQSPAPTDTKSRPPARSEKMDPPLVPTDENSLLPGPSEEKDPPPAPIHKINKISKTKETFTKKPEPEKSRPEKVTLKAISRRHRVTCTAIVSRYSRKRRNMVLTDSDASLCVLKSDSSSDNESNKNPKIQTKTPPFITKEAKIVLKQMKTSELIDTSSEKSISNPTSKIQKLNICSTENASKIKSDIPNVTPELQKPKKIDSISEIIPPMLPVVEIPNSEQHENNSGKSQPQLESKKEDSQKSLNPESSDVIENPICPKPAETRGTRSALKTIATPGPGGDSVGTNRKKPLPKEKENQSKQAAKPCKIIVVARRRRPVTLEDSSTATTLVSSAQETNCDRPSNTNSLKNTLLSSEKPELAQTVSDLGSKGRKRRSADK